MKRAVSLNVLNVDGPRATGLPVRGVPGARREWGTTRSGPEAREGGDGTGKDPRTGAWMGYPGRGGRGGDRRMSDTASGGQAARE